MPHQVSRHRPPRRRRPAGFRAAGIRPAGLCIAAPPSHRPPLAARRPSRRRPPSHRPPLVARRPVDPKSRFLANMSRFTNFLRPFYRPVARLQTAPEQIPSSRACAKSGGTARGPGSARKLVKRDIFARIRDLGSTVVGVRAFRGGSGLAGEAAGRPRSRIRDGRGRRGRGCPDGGEGGRTGARVAGRRRGCQDGGEGGRQGRGRWRRGQGDGGADGRAGDAEAGDAEAGGVEAGDAEAGREHRCRPGRRGRRRGGQGDGGADGRIGDAEAGDAEAGREHRCRPGRREEIFEI